MEKGEVQMQYDPDVLKHTVGLPHTPIDYSVELIIRAFEGAWEGSHHDLGAWDALFDHHPLLDRVKHLKFSIPVGELYACVTEWLAGEPDNQSAK